MEAEVIIKTEDESGVKIKRFDSRQSGNLHDTMVDARGAIERRTPAADIPVHQESAVIKSEAQPKAQQKQQPKNKATVHKVTKKKKR